MGKKQPLGVSKNAGRKFTAPARQTDTQRLQEAPHTRNLANLFQDRRFGAGNPHLDDETKNLKRFTKERQFLSRRKEKFALDDEDTFALTHKGEKLEDLPDDYVEDFEEEAEDSDLDPEVVESMHFSSAPDSRTPRERYEEIIAKSKYNKYLQHKEKEDMKILANQVDKELPALHSTLQFRDFGAARALDDYDLLVNELKDEVRVSADGDGGYAAALEAKKALEDAGLDFTLSDYPAFVSALAGDEVATTVQHFVAWNSPKLPSQQGQAKVLLSHLLRFVSQEDCVAGLLRTKQYSAVLEAAHQLCVQYPETACECVSKLLEARCSGLSNTVAFIDLLGNLLPVKNLVDESVVRVRHMCEALFLRTSLQSEDACCWMLLLAVIYAKKWLFPGTLFAPELFGLLRRVLVKTKCEQPQKDSTLRSLVLKPNFTKAKHQCCVLLVESMKVYKSVAFKAYFPRLVALAKNEEVDEAYKSVFDPQTAELQIQVSKVQEIPTYEPLLLDKITTLHKNKDMKKTLTETDKLKQEVKTAKKEARKALQRQSFAEELRRQEEHKLAREQREKKGRKATAALDDLQAEYKRMVTSQGELRKTKVKRRRMAGYDMEQT